MKQDTLPILGFRYLPQTQQVKWLLWTIQLFFTYIKTMLVGIEYQERYGSENKK
ncbi:MAG TPA: hypothetical protein VFR94_23850 [Nitrososphaeraceae archaeon]|nr:hypothetical protein [Nitrososphaeraceae archaeon]